MNLQPYLRPTNFSWFIPIVTAGFTIAIFILDTVTNLEIAVPVLYTAVVLTSMRFCTRRGVIVVGVGCIALTFLSDLLTAGSSEAGAINTAISVLAISATTYLALQIETAEAEIHEGRAQLAHLSRVTTLGELTASIAHQVNQPLTASVINGNACLRWLAGQPPNLDEVRGAIERMVKDSSRAAEIIARIRDLAKRSAPQKEELNINEIILEVIKLTTAEIEDNRISLETDFRDDLPVVLGDRIQLQQVILNLILNAVEALSGTTEGSRQILVSTAQHGAKAVLVGIRDTGGGLDPGNLERIFGAFYTTKRDGLGMGLAISRSIVEAHGGRIWAAPNTPRGAVFQFILPAGPGEISSANQ